MARGIAPVADVRRDAVGTLQGRPCAGWPPRRLEHGSVQQRLGEVRGRCGAFGRDVRQASGDAAAALPSRAPCWLHRPGGTRGVPLRALRRRGPRQNVASCAVKDNGTAATTASVAHSACLCDGSHHVGPPLRRVEKVAPRCHRRPRRRVRSRSREASPQHRSNGLHARALPGFLVVVKAGSLCHLDASCTSLGAQSGLRGLSQGCSPVPQVPVKDHQSGLRCGRPKRLWFGSDAHAAEACVLRRPRRGPWGRSSWVSAADSCSRPGRLAGTASVWTRRARLGTDGNAGRGLQTASLLGLRAVASPAGRLG